MLNTLFGSILQTTTSGESFSVGGFLICLLASLLLGGAIALLHTFRNTCTKSFAVTLALLPAIVQVVIMLVNGNLGTGVAVMGAFSLIRFRSVPGSAKEICSIFLAMAVGLATGMGYIGIAVLFLLVMGTASLLYTLTRFGEHPVSEKDLKITIPEGLDYTNVFDDLFEAYTKKTELIEVKTTNMGSLFKLHYRVTLKNPAAEKALLDELRCRNGNLEISCGRVAFGREEL
ncbi:MAG: DUF4956 domain-containing protein [Candidatus Howiella sp.]